MMDRILFLYTFILLNLAGEGKHFLGGTITWHPLNQSATGTPVAIVITQTYSWTYLLMSCDNAMIAANQLVPPYGNIPLDTLQCIANCGATSAGYSPLNVTPSCTDFSAPVGNTVGQRSDIVYLQSGDDFTVAFQDSSWRPLATGSGAAWSISANINLQIRSDTGFYNNAPVATMMSPINIPVNQTTVINVPIADADGDTLRCRWSTNTNGTNECGGVCPPNSLPPNTIIYPNCTIIITGQNISDWFAVTLMVEDFINSTSTIPLSSVPVQFLVHVVGTALCRIPPDIIGLPLESSCTPVIVGEEFSSELIAINNCGSNVSISDIATLSFSGMVKSNISELNSTEYDKNLTWTPTSAQLGYQVMCAMAMDSQNVQSAQYCFKFYVSMVYVCSCPGDPCIPTTSTSIISTPSISMSTTVKPVDPINWVLIGIIIGLILLGALALLTYFCCFYDITNDWRKRKGMIELYHIEECVDPDCRYLHQSYSPDVFFTCRTPYATTNSSNISGSEISSSLTNRKNNSGDDVRDAEMVVFRDRSVLSTIADRFRRRPTSNVSVTRVKSADRMGVEGNPGIKHPIDTAKNGMNNSPVFNFRKGHNVTVSRIGTAITPKTIHRNGRIQNTHGTIKPFNSIHSSFQSAKDLRMIRMNNLLRESSMRCSSQCINNQTREPSEISNRTNVTIIRVPSLITKKLIDDHITETIQFS